MQSSSQFSTLIKAQRQKFRMSQSLLAAASGVSTSFVRDAETQAGRCTLDKLLRLTAALDLELTLTVNTPNSI